MKHKLKKINIEKIILDKNNPRINRTIDVEKLALNIKEVGLLNPILVKSYGDEYRVVDGERRFRAIKSLKWKAINCVILEGDNDILFCQVSICVNNRNLPVFPDKAQAIYNLSKKTGMSSKELSKKLGIDVSYLNKLKKYWETLGTGVDKKDLVPLEMLTARIIDKFDFLKKEEKLKIGKEIEQLKKDKIISISSIKTLIPYFGCIKKEDQKSILKFGFMAAFEWAKEFKLEQDKIKYKGISYHGVHKSLSTIITHLEWLLEGISTNTYNMKDYQMSTLRFMLMPLFLKLKEILKEK